MLFYSRIASSEQLSQTLEGNERLSFSGMTCLPLAQQQSLYNCSAFHLTDYQPGLKDFLGFDSFVMSSFEGCKFS